MFPIICSNPQYWFLKVFKSSSGNQACPQCGLNCCNLAVSIFSPAVALDAGSILGICAKIRTPQMGRETRPTQIHKGHKIQCERRFRVKKHKRFENQPVTVYYCLYKRFSVWLRITTDSVSFASVVSLVLDTFFCECFVAPYFRMSLHARCFSLLSLFGG